MKSAELRIQIVNLEDQCSEMTVDAGDLLAENRALHKKVVALGFVQATWAAIGHHSVRGAIA